MTTETKLPVDHRATVFSLESGRPLLKRVCQHLGVEPGDHEERDFEDGEHKIRPLESVRGRDVFFVESLYSDEELSVNDKVLRTLFFLSALRDAGARRVTVLAPYLCYARKDRRTKPRDPVSIRYLATLFEAVGIDRIVTVDVHNPSAYENAFRIPAEHLTAAPLFVDAFAPLVADPLGPETAALEAQKGQLGERVEQAERPVELEAIDHHWVLLQADVLRPQVAVGVDPPIGPGLEERFVLGEPPVLAADHRLEIGAIEAVTRPLQGGVLRVEGGSELSSVLVTGPANRLGVEVERRQLRPQPVNALPLHRPMMKTVR